MVNLVQGELDCLRNAVEQSSAKGQIMQQFEKNKRDTSVPMIVEDDQSSEIAQLKMDKIEF